MEGISILWILVATALVFFMQAGFAMVETGFTRAKNAGNIIMKNLMDFSIGAPIYWLVGFGIMFGVGNGFAGTFDLMSLGDYSAVLPNGVPLYAFLIFQTVFCATASTIVSGAMAERTKFSSYCIYSAIISLLVYPISGHWIWGGGWLAQLGFHDFAGSTAVHMVGGVAALIGAAILGPRIGKFKNGKAKAIPGHSLTLGALGVFILWFCWFGFNGGSTLSFTGDAPFYASKVFVNTNLAASIATVTVMIITWIKFKKPDVSMTLNGSLAGLVAITAGCDTVSPWAAALIGILAGFAVVFGIRFIENVLKIDDPVGAVGVHGICGALGTLFVGLFSDGSGTSGLQGLFIGGNGKLLGVQALGVVTVAAWVAVVMTALFFILKYTNGLRVSHEVEVAGLDIAEHGLVSYADFMPLKPMGITSVGKDYSPLHKFICAKSGKKLEGVDEPKPVPMHESVPVEIVMEDKNGVVASDVKFSKVTVVCNQSKFEDLKRELGAIGITGITVTQVLGCGQQKGTPEYYRGAPLEITLLPKIKVEVVVCKVPVTQVITATKKALYTGHIGDGKIFVYNVEDVIKVRTGETGYDALQDE